jgi:rhodanese-related sulfurtransferase
MKLKIALGFAVALAGLALGGAAAAGNRITPDLESVDVIDHGKIVTIRRTDDRNATLPNGYDRVGRHCPPFCIQPMHVVPGVETVGELEVLDYLKRMAAGDKSILLVDSRNPDWWARGTIPGAVHVPWSSIDTDVSGSFESSTEAKGVDHIMEGMFGAVKTDSGWDFSKAKTLVLFCNGIWCAQSATNLRTLTKLGYPADKLKWYRGGMQDWVSAGLTTVVLPGL